MLGACSQSTYPNLSTQVVDSTEVDEAVFWPPHPHYIAQSDTAVIEMVGLQRGFTCGTVLACKMDTDFSNADSTALQAYAKIEYPGAPNCPLDSAKGVDTTLRLITSQPLGSVLYLDNSAGVHTDTALIVSAKVQAVTLLSIPTDSDTVSGVGPFILYDATAGHPSYELYADTLPACEVLQSAVYSYSGDTLKVLFHLLLLDSTTSQLSLPPCSGPQINDSVQVVPDLFNLPSF